MITLIFLSQDLGSIIYDPDSTFILSNELMLSVLITFLLVLGLAIAQSLLSYRLVQRRDAHFRRDWMLREGMIEYLGARSLEKTMDLNVERWTMNTIHKDSNVWEYERSAILWCMFVGIMSFIPVIGHILIIVFLQSITREQQYHERNQVAFNHQLLMGLSKLGKPSPPVNWMPAPRRNTLIYATLSILTLAFFLPFWWYVIITDFNAHLDDQAQFEDQFMKGIQ
jgi:hypothetical protein